MTSSGSPTKSPNGVPHAQSQSRAEASKIFSPEIDALVRRVITIENSLDAKQKRIELSEAEHELAMQEKEAIFKLWKQQEINKLEGEKQQFDLDRQAHQRRMMWEKESLQKERSDFQEMLKRGPEIIHQHQQPITVEVGGEKFRTELHTLSKCKGSIFPSLVDAMQRSRENESPQSPHSRQKQDPHVFIDRDGKHFRFILNYLRQGEQVLRGSALQKADDYVLRDIIHEVQYYKIVDLEHLVLRRMVSNRKTLDFNMLVTSQLFKKNTTPSASKYKYITAKEFLLKEQNLTGITFHQVLFQHTMSFEGCVMVGAIFNQCEFCNAVNFTNVDLFKARFENCEGLRLSERFTLNQANMRDVVFNPPLDIPIDNK